MDERRGKETILLADDEEYLLAIWSDVLTELGYKVLTASSGQQAISVAVSYSDKIDLLITDVVMPDLSGPELAEKIQSARPGMKVLFVSGYPEGTVSEGGSLKSGTALLAKPFSIKHLLSKLRQVLDN